MEGEPAEPIHFASAHVDHVDHMVPFFFFALEVPEDDACLRGRDIQPDHLVSVVGSHERRARHADVASRVAADPVH